MIFHVKATVCVLFCFLYTSCSVLTLNDSALFNASVTPTTKVLLVVDTSVSALLKTEIAIWTSDVAADGIQVEKIDWSDPSPMALKAVLNTRYTNSSLNGAFLVGTIASAWYELNSFDQPERFPTDLFYMDPSANWYDKNSNGDYDSHDPLAAKIFVSRITGSVSELKSYFGKDHAYRTGNLSLPKTGWIFKDDSWANYEVGSTFGLNRLYDTVVIRDAIPQTLRPDYMTQMESSGSEFVYQWIHATPGNLYVEDKGTYSLVSTADIASNTFRGMFYNLYDCSAARFTETNLSMTYLTKTPFGLATLGSTKIGGSYYSLPFFTSLAEGSTWGEAFRSWYNSYGYKDDGWFLGMVIQGDPTLRVKAAGSKTYSYRVVETGISPEPDASGVASLGDSFKQFYKVLPR